MNPPPLRSLRRGLAIVSISLLAQAAALEGAAPIRIKAASPKPITDELGQVWEADRGFEGGEIIFRPELDIANTKTPSLYRSERYSMAGFKQALPNGKYTVKLHFAETFEDIAAAGDRAFHFSVEGAQFRDFDVYKLAGGPNRAHVVTVPVEIKDGQLDITFTHKVENPQINAIELLPAP